MKRSTVGVVVMTGVYMTVFGIALGAVADTYGNDSFAFYVVSIGMGTIGFILLVTHKGLNTFLAGLDGKIEKDVDDEL